MGHPLELSTGADQLKPLPWSGIDQILLGFTTDIGSFDATHLNIYGVNTLDYGALIDSVTYDPITFTATIQFSTPIETDKLLIMIDEEFADIDGNLLDGEWTDNVTTQPSGDGNVGGNFLFHFDVLVGDVNRDGQVRANDGQVAFGKLFSSAGEIDYLAEADINGNGQIRANDGQMIFSHLFDELPAGEPVALSPIVSSPIVIATTPLPRPALLAVTASVAPATLSSVAVSLPAAAITSSVISAAISAPSASLVQQSVIIERVPSATTITLPNVNKGITAAELDTIHVTRHNSKPTRRASFLRRSPGGIIAPKRKSAAEFVAVVQPNRNLFVDKALNDYLNPRHNLQSSEFAHLEEPLGVEALDEVFESIDEDIFSASL